MNLNFQNMNFLQALIVVFMFFIAMGFTIEKGEGIRFFGMTLLKKTSTPRKSPHGNCPHANDIIVLLNKSFNLQHKAFMVEYIATMKEQMSYAEQKADYLKSIMRRVYLSLLEKKKGDSRGLVHSKGVLHYRTVVELTARELLDRIRGKFRENRFVDMNEAEYHAYIAETANTMLSNVNELLDLIYIDLGGDISRKELSQANEDIVPVFEQSIIEIFEYARKVGVEKKLEIEHLEAEIANLTSFYLNGKETTHARS